MTNPHGFTPEVIERAAFLAAHLDAATLEPEHLTGLDNDLLRDALLATIAQCYPDDGEGWITTIGPAAMMWSLAPTHGGHLVAPRDLAAAYMIAAVLAYLDGQGPDALALAGLAWRLSPSQRMLAEMLEISVISSLPPRLFAQDVLWRIDLDTGQEVTAVNA